MSNNATPYEVLAAPYELWIAPTGTAFPDVDTAPSGSWVKLGTSGSRSQNEEGVKVSNPQTLAYFKTAGSTGPRKAFRTSEEFLVEVKLADMSLEQMKYAFNGVSITTTAPGVGTPGTKKFGLSRGLIVGQHALLARGPSPYMAAGAMQFELPVVVHEGNQEFVGKKDTPQMLGLVFRALEDPSASSDAERFGRIVAQTADANT